MKTRSTTFAALLVLPAVLGLFAWSASGDEDFARAEFSVRKLSCGSCVQNIRAALEEMDGVGKVDVSVTSGRARVEYLSSAVNPEKIGGRISEAGYPAQLLRTLSAADYRALQEDFIRLAGRYVGRIGERLVSRTDFAEVLSRYEGGEVPKQGLLKAVWNDILQRELLLGAAEKNEVVVQEWEVDMQLEKVRKEAAEFEAAVDARFSDEDTYRRRLKEDMIIRRTIADHVLKGESDRSRQRLLLDRWYGDLSASVSVTIFDPVLKAAVERGGKGCGGSCCG